MRRSNLPVPVFLKRLAMDLRVFCMRMRKVLEDIVFHHACKGEKR